MLHVDKSKSNCCLVGISMLANHSYVIHLSYIVARIHLSVAFSSPSRPAVMERSVSSTPLPSIGHELQPIQARAAEPGSVADATLRLVIEKHNRFYLNTIPFNSSDAASVVMEKIRAKWEEFFTQISLCKPLHDLLWMHSIDIVTMCTVCSPCNAMLSLLILNLCIVSLRP